MIDPVITFDCWNCLTVNRMASGLCKTCGNHHMCLLVWLPLLIKYTYSVHSRIRNPILTNAFWLMIVVVGDYYYKQNVCNFAMQECIWRYSYIFIEKLVLVVLPWDISVFRWMRSASCVCAYFLRSFDCLFVSQYY